MKKIKEALKEVLIHKEDDIEAQKIIASLCSKKSYRNCLSQDKMQCGSHYHDK